MFVLSQALILFYPSYLDLFLSAILLVISINDIKYFRIQNIFVMLIFSLGIFSRKLITPNFDHLNFYTSILFLIGLSFLSFFTDMFGMGDLKLLIGMFFVKGSSYFIKTFFIINILLFLYSLMSLMIKRDTKMLIPLGPFVYFSHLLIILGGL